MANNVTLGQVEFHRYVQSTFKIKTGNMIVWVDPFMVTEEHIGDDKADLILVTHEHGDHFNLDAINRVSKEGSQLVCNNSGIEDKIRGNVSAPITVMKEDDTVNVANLDIQAVAGYNDIHPRNNGYDSFNIGYIFSLGGQRILHTGDTGLIDEFNGFGNLDIAMVPIGNANFTMDEEEAARAINGMLKPRIAIPMHYGFATGGDPEKFKGSIGGSAEVHVLDAVFPPMQ